MVADHTPNVSEKGVFFEEFIFVLLMTLRFWADDRYHYPLCRIKSGLADYTKYWYIYTNTIACQKTHQLHLENTLNKS